MRIDEQSYWVEELDRDVRVRIFLPDGYERGERRYPVLYINDGQDVFRDDQTLWEMESLRFEQYYRDYGRFLPQVILVAVESAKERSARTAE